MRAFIGWSGVLAVTLLASALPLQGQGQSGAVMVVNASNPATTVTRQLAEQLFLKQRTRWSDNTLVMVVDQGEQSAVRRAFSRQVLKREVAAVKTYWQQMIFTGRSVPPPEVPSDAEVLAVVRANAGAIGYVSAGAQMGAGVKVLPISM